MTNGEGPVESPITDAGSTGAERRCRFATFLMALTIGAWGFAIWQRLQVGEMTVAVWNGLVCAAVVLALLGVHRRRPWGYEWILPAKLMGGITSLVQAVQGHPWLAGVTALHVIAFALVLGSRNAFYPPPPGAKGGDRASPPTFEQWLRDNCEAVVVAFVLALVIRCFFLEVFKIPTGSMQPTLWGDQKDSATSQIRGAGDRIMVDKFLYALKPVERFEVIVFRFPLNTSRNFIKRAIGVGPEEILLYQGDVYYRKPGDSEFSAAHKPFRIQQSVWIPMPAFDIDPTRREQGVKENWDPPALAEWSCSSGELRFEAPPGTREPDFFKLNQGITDGYEGAPSYLQRESNGDARIRLTARRDTSESRLGLHLYCDADDFWISLGETGTFRRVRNGTSSAEESFGPLPELAAGQTSRIEAMLYDGICTVVLNGRKAGEFVYRNTYAELDRTAARRRGIEFGALAGSCSVENVKVDHDLFYLSAPPLGGGSILSEGTPFFVPAGKYFAMGDNSPSSHDSRLWREETITYLDDRNQTQTISGDTSSNFTDLDMVVLRNGRRYYGRVETRDDKMVKVTLDDTTRLIPRSQLDGEPRMRSVLRVNDLSGTERFIPHDRIVERRPEVHAPFVSDEEMVGRAFFVWLPLERVKLIK
ncbi:MAG: signal peptidase I [Planctomycetes bacterium]|nr:signal peptidase I [Planctomycetota bacterium]